jgi:hypothetical protein
MKGLITFFIAMAASAVAHGTASTTHCGDFSNEWLALNFTCVPPGPPPLGCAGGVGSYTLHLLQISNGSGGWTVEGSVSNYYCPNNQTFETLTITSYSGTSVDKSTAHLQVTAPATAQYPCAYLTGWTIALGQYGCSQAFNDPVPGNVMPSPLTAVSAITPTEVTNFDFWTAANPALGKYTMNLNASIPEWGADSNYDWSGRQLQEVFTGQGADTSWCNLQQLPGSMWQIPGTSATTSTYDDYVGFVFGGSTADQQENSMGNVRAAYYLLLPCGITSTQHMQIDTADANNHLAWSEYTSHTLSLQFNNTQVIINRSGKQETKTVGDTAQIWLNFLGDIK